MSASRQVGTSPSRQVSRSAGRQAGRSGGSAGRHVGKSAGRSAGRQFTRSATQQVGRSEHSETTPYPHEFLHIPKIWNEDLTKSGRFWCDAPTPRSMLVRGVRRRPAAVQRGVVVGPPWPVRVCFFGARCASASSVPSGMPACRGLDFER